MLPGDTFEERAAVLADPQRMRAALPGLPAQVNAFLGKAVAAVRARFGGRIGYASLPFEGVDWTPFDIVATDAGYRDAQTADRLADGLRALTAYGKPAAVTEFGCTTYRGAADVGGRGDAVIAWDDRARPVRFTSPVARDEQEQAEYLRELIDTFDESAIDAAFVNTFARYDLPHAGRRRRPRLRQSVLRRGQGPRRRPHRHRVPGPAVGAQSRLPHTREVRPQPDPHKLRPRCSRVRSGGCRP